MSNGTIEKIDGELLTTMESMEHERREGAILILPDRDCT